MTWHLAHRHEMPAAVDALGKQYEAKTLSLQEENHKLRKERDQLRAELDEARLSLLEERATNIESNVEITRLRRLLEKTEIALAVRDHILQEKLNIQPKNLFE